MTLTLAQRLERFQVRMAELEFWRVHKTVQIEGWRCNDTPIALGEAWPQVRGTQRFAGFAVVPAGWPLEDTRLYVDLGGESLITIASEDGTAKTVGLDPYHREFGVPATRFTVTSETVARLPFGEPVRKPHLERAELLWLEPSVDRLWLLVRQIAEAIAVLEGHDVVPHLLDAGEEALRSLDWPSATADYVSRTSMAPMQQKIWQLPDLKSEPAGLDDHHRASVTKAYDALMARLAALRERFPPQGKIALTGHAHIDLAWLWPYDETRRKIRRTFHTALSLMEGSNDFRFNQSTAHYYAQIAEDDPDLLERVKEQVKAGKWETVGGLWIEPDTNMPTGESLSRQVLYGQRYFEKTFGLRHTVCWLPDCFGFTGALPQILRQGGMKSFFTIKVNWSETNRFPADLFWWEGIDGSRVLAHTFDNPMQGYNGFVRPDCFVPTWKNFRQKDKHETTLLCVGYGDGGGGVTPEMVTREEQLRVFPAIPQAAWTRVEDFFDGAHKTASRKALHVWQGEIYLELHRATLTSQSAVKRLHRKAERTLITAETVAGLAHLMGADRPASLEPTWRVVLKNEFHDILPGSSIAEVYVDAVRELDGAIAEGAGALDQAMSALARRLPAASGGESGTVLVVNPSLSSRAIRLNMPDGPVSAEGSVPPLGIAVLPASAIAPAPGLKVTKNTLENATLKVTLAEDGSIASLLHKPTGREAIEGRGNRLYAYTADKPRNWDAWDVENDYVDKAEEITGFDAIEIVETGPHRAAIRIKRTWRHSSIVQTLSLGANARRLDIHTEIDWHDRRVMLRSLSELAVKSRMATCECAYGVLERPTGSNTSWDEAMFEAPAHRFVDLSEPDFGVALINDAKYGHSMRGSVLGLSLLRSPIYPDPMADEGYQAFTYSLMPHAGTWYEGGVREEAEELNQPLVVLPVTDRAVGAWQPLAPKGIDAALSGLKPSEDGDDLVLRVFEPAGRRGDFSVTLPDGWAMSAPVTILEEPMDDVAATGLLPFEVKSWRLTRS
ncbi:alpha-mannosidase [Rhizobium sp. Leaf341]|uniref:alpha-mannosidase n=1 Tax=Rhizobium sp. Leaf341 TaxID=1736344 RepID=UPI000715FFF0|nr:glycoside hydrolase family 38 C-terminal domain-containing protein [Rhizobium sp. Leaf341]KQR73153.1 alpha-mannosidase [Rhizobium sp. Leaf341]